MCYVASKAANQELPAGLLKVDRDSRAIQATMVSVRRDSTWLRVRTTAWGTNAISAFHLEPLLSARWVIIFGLGRGRAASEHICKAFQENSLLQVEKLLLLMGSVAL